MTQTPTSLLVTRRAADVLCLALSALAVYVAGFGTFDNAVVSGGSVFLGLVIVVLRGTGSGESEADAPLRRLDLVGRGVLIAAICMIMWNWLRVMLAQEEFFIEIERTDHILAWCGFMVIGWLTWRAFGTPMMLVYVLMIVYVLLGDLFPSVLRGSAEEWTRVAENLWYSTDGTYGRPVEVVGRVVLIFVVFGAVLQGSGAGAVLLKFAYAATGRFAGGPAHASIVGSAMFGTMSGAAVANVVSTGVFTIPIIKRAGFSARFAGGVEAAASTGGQIMPPVMGVVAFLMADVTGIPYLEIVVAATIPALLYYLSLFTVVLVESRKLGMKPVPPSERERLTANDWLKSSAFFVPLGVIIAVLITGRTPQIAGFAALIAAFVLCLALFPAYRSPRAILASLVDAGRTGATLMLIVAAIGLVIGVINMTGSGLKFAEAILSVSGDSLFVSLLLVMMGCLVLGMGVPTGAAYLIIALVMGPALQKLGLPTIAAHLFVVYFGVLSVVTPPVALAAFAAAPIAGSKPMETGFEALRLAIAGFLIPFLFVYHPSLLLIDGVIPAKLIWALTAFGLSTWALATGLGGFDARHLGRLERLLRAGAGLVVLVPDLLVATPAAAVIVFVTVLHRLQSRRGESTTTIAATTPEEHP